MQVQNEESFYFDMKFFFNMNIEIRIKTNSVKNKNLENLCFYQGFKRSDVI